MANTPVFWFEDFWYGVAWGVLATVLAELIVLAIVHENPDPLPPGTHVIVTTLLAPTSDVISNDCLELRKDHLEPVSYKLCVADPKVKVRTIRLGE